MTLREVLALGEDSVIVLDRLTDELLDVTVNGKLIARGEVVPQGTRFGLRIVELVGEDAPAAPASAPATLDLGGELGAPGMGAEFG